MNIAAEKAIEIMNMDRPLNQDEKHFMNNVASFFGECETTGNAFKVLLMESDTSKGVEHEM